MMRTLRDLLLFFQRDLRIASTYRSPFVLEAIEALFGVAMFYYVARFVDSPELRNTCCPVATLGATPASPQSAPRNKTSPHQTALRSPPEQTGSGRCWRSAGRVEKRATHHEECASCGASLHIGRYGAPGKP